jgi:uncharacterized protein with HEPN domain
MSSRDPQLLVEDILEAANKIIQYCNGLNFEEFTSDSKTIDAVVRNFEIIGEAANRLPGDFKDLHPTVDWQRIRGFRNRIVHHYFGIDKSILWQVKETYLPDLVLTLSKVK